MRPADIKDYAICKGLTPFTVIDGPRVVQKILRHPGVWHAPPAGLSPPRAAGP